MGNKKQAGALRRYCRAIGKVWWTVVIGLVFGTWGFIQTLVEADTIDPWVQQAPPLPAWLLWVVSFFALLKRGVIGTFHNVSRKHLHRYVAEFEFRWNTRQMDDGARVVRAIQGSEGKRLRYAQP